MEQTLGRIAESLAVLLEQKDATEAEGRGRLRPQRGRRFVPSHDSLPSYEQLSSSPSSFSSNNNNNNNGLNPASTTSHESS